jgi:hypothetical protein
VLRVVVALALLLAGCAGGDGDTATVGDQATTTASAATPAGPCALKPLTFVHERWQASTVPPPAEGGVLWEQPITFSNPNSVPVRLSSIVVHLRLASSNTFFLKFARSNARSVPDEVIPAGGDQQRMAHAWLAPGNTTATEDLYATTSATVAGTECPVPVERLSTSPVPAHVLALPSCEPLPTNAPC